MEGRPSFIPIGANVANTVDINNERKYTILDKLLFPETSREGSYKNKKQKLKNEKDDKK